MQRRVVFAIAFFVGAGCSRVDKGPSSDGTGAPLQANADDEAPLHGDLDKQPASQAEEEPSFKPALLPGISGAQECVGDPTAGLAFCDWAGAADVLFIAEVAAVRLFEAPFVVPERDANAVIEEGTCSGFVNPGLAIDMIPKAVFLGSEDQVTLGNPVTVFLGTDHVYGDWVLYPYHGDDGTVIWGNEPESRDVFAQGSVLGVSATFVQGRLSLMGRDPFTIDAAGNLLADHNLCEPTVLNFGVSTLTQLQNAVAECPTTPSPASETLRRGRNSKPAATFAAACHVGEAFDCQRDDECDLGRCVDGTCAATPLEEAQ